MKLAMAQMKMSADMNENLQKSLDYIEKAKGKDLLFFPEIQLTPFFPQYEESELESVLGITKDDICLDFDCEAIKSICSKCKETGIYLSPNFYMKENGKNYDMSLMIDNKGSILGRSKMVHVLSAPKFYETYYYTSSEDGYIVYDTPFGKIGVVICFDRHLPESIRTCALKGAELVIIPTANVKAEPLDMFEWEVRVQAYQNNVFVAMCNRVGVEGDMDFAGESLVVDCDGNVLYKADDEERLIEVDLDLDKCRESRKKRPYLNLRRPEMYE